MDELATARFIYAPSAVLEFLLLFLVLGSIFKPRLLTALAVGILLVRPNERMALGIPFVQVLLPVLLFAVVSHAGKFKEQRDIAGGKYLKFFIFLMSVQTVLYHPSDLAAIFVSVATGVLLYCAILLFMGDDAGFRMLCHAVLISCFLVLLEPMYYHFTEPKGSELWNMFHLVKSGRLQAWGMWANANETAYLACLAVANLMMLAAKSRSGKLYLACTLLVPFFTLVVVLTASRAGFASLLLVFTPALMFLRSSSAKFAALLAILCALLASQAMTPVRVDAAASTEERGYLRVRGREMVAQNPVMGVGFGRARYETAGIPLHNTYLQAFAETGIPGGCLLMIFLFRLGVNAYAFCKSSRNRISNRHFVFLLGLYCSSLFYFFWANQLLSVLFFLVMAQVSSAVNNAAPAGEQVGVPDSASGEAAVIKC